MTKIAANLGTANDFNVFILGDDTQSNTDSEGRVAVAGRAVLSNYGIGDKLTRSTTRADLIVGGTLNVAGGENFNGNTVISSRANVVSYTMTHGNGVTGQPLEGTPIDFTAETAYLQCASGSWADLTPNGTVSVAYGGLTLTGTDPVLNIFQIDGTNIDNSKVALAGLNKIDIVAPAGSTILINVTGKNLGFGSYGIFRNGSTATGADGQFILWNLSEAENLAAGTTSVKGSLLAPYAVYIAGYSNIEGTLIVKTLTGNIEAHNYLFGGTLPDPECTDNPNPPGPGGNGGSCAYRQSTTDVIESIALEQTALSHILNAEGEKIQKAVSMDIGAGELLGINQSVAGMVERITLLEQILLEKARIAKEICSGERTTES